MSRAEGFPNHRSEYMRVMGTREGRFQEKQLHVPQISVAVVVLSSGWILSSQLPDKWARARVDLQRLKYAPKLRQKVCGQQRPWTFASPSPSACNLPSTPGWPSGPRQGAHGGSVRKREIHERTLGTLEPPGGARARRRPGSWINFRTRLDGGLWLRSRLIAGVGGASERAQRQQHPRRWPPSLCRLCCSAGCLASSRRSQIRPIRYRGVDRSGIDCCPPRSRPPDLVRRGATTPRA